MSFANASDRRTLAAALLIFLVGFAARATLWIVTKPDRNLPDTSEIHNIVVSISQDGVFGSPYGPKTGPTAHSSPVYPGLKGLLYRYVGDETGELIANFVSICIAAAGPAMLPMLSVCFGLPLFVGFVAGLAGALLPVEFMTELRSYEPLSTLLLLVLTALTYRTWRDKRFSLARGLLHGLVWGVLLLTHSVFVLVMAAWLAASFFVRGSSSRVAWYAAGVLIAGAAVNAPWVIRNYRVLGEPVLFRSNFGIELFNANNSRSQVTYHAYVASHAHAALHPSGNTAAAERLHLLGEPAYGRERTRIALQWIEANPVRFLQLTFLRVVQFWFPTDRLFQIPILGAISLLGLAGLYPLWKARREAAILFLLTYVTFPAVYYVLHAEHRHSMPLRPFLLLGATLFVMQCLLRFPRFKSMGPDPSGVPAT